MDIIYLFKVLLRKKWILIIVPLISLMAAIFFTKDLPKEYKSTAQLATGFTTKESPSYYDEEFNLRDASIKFVNVIETMKSQLVVNLLSYRLILHDLNKEKQPFRKLEKEKMEELINKNILSFTPGENDSLIKTIEKKLDNFELLNSYIPREKKILELLKSYRYNYGNLNKELRIYRLSNSDYLGVDFRSENPFLSSFVVNVLSEEFIRYYNNLKSSHNTHSLEFYHKLKLQKKKNLDEKTEELEKIRASDNLAEVGYESGTKLEQIKEYDFKRDDIIEEKNALELQIEDLNRRINSFDNVTVSSGSNARIVEIQNKINELQKIKLNNPNPPDELDLTIQQLRDELRTEMASLSNTSDRRSLDELKEEKNKLELQLKITNSNLQNINRRLYSLRNAASGIASKESKIEAAEKEVEKAMEEYLQASNEYNKEQNKSLITSSSINLVIPGQPSEEPESSKRIIIVGLSAFASFFLCVFAIIFTEYIDVRIKTPNVFKRQTKLKLAGYINFIDSKKLDLNHLFAQDEEDQEYETFKRFLRKLRYEILSNANDHIYLVTSTKKGEGKTLLILSLAYSLSLLNKKVLIIDTNFKNNSLTRILLPEGQHIDNLLEQKTKLLTDSRSDQFDYQKSSSIISGTSHQNIDLIGSKRVTDSPSEIFSDRKFDDLIRQLVLQYDYIFLEGAALNEFSDTKELINYVDKVIPVFSAESVIKQKDRESIDYLRNLNGKLLGSVLNKVRLKDLEI